MFHPKVKSLNKIFFATFFSLHKPGQRTVSYFFRFFIVVDVVVVCISLRSEVVVVGVVVVVLVVVVVVVVVLVVVVGSPPGLTSPFSKGANSRNVGLPILFISNF